MSFVDLLRAPKRPTALSGQWPHDMPLVQFSPLAEDIWTLEDAFQGTVIFGSTGSGKTSGSGQLLALKFLKAGFGGLVLCVDIEEANLWRSYLKAAGRLKDGLFFSIDSPLRFNFLDYEAAKSGVDFIENLVTLLCDAASVQRRSEATGSEAHFWLPQKQKLMRNAITLLSLAGAPVQLKNLYKVIIESATSQLQADSEKWQTTSYVYDLLCRAEAKSGKHSEFDPVKDYWLRERPALDPKTRSNIDADFTGMFDPLTRGKIGELFGTTTNIRPDDIMDGKIIVIDIPVDKYREIGQHAGVIWAQLFQRAVDRRRYVAPFVRPVFLWEDEAHYFTIEQDARFQTTARKKGIAVVRLTQNLPNFLDAYGRDGQHKVNTLLGNHETKILHRNGDPTTNEWASKVIAKETQYKHSMSSSGSLQSNSGFNSQTSVSEVEEESCSPKEFIGLKNGGWRNKREVEAIVFQSGRLWRKNQRWTVCRFKQNRLS
jgi:hypothetical protein